MVRNVVSERPLDPFQNKESPKSYEWRPVTIQEAMYYVMEPYVRGPRAAAICGRTLRSTFKQSHYQRLIGIGTMRPYEHGDHFTIIEPPRMVSFEVESDKDPQRKIASSQMTFRLEKRVDPYSADTGFVFRFLEEADIKRYLEWWPSLEIIY